MKIFAILLSGFFIFGLETVVDSSATASDWQSAKKAAREVKRMKRKGMIPASIKCRNEPGISNRLKPQAQINWKKNTSNREWAAFIYKGQLDFMPGNRAQIKQWRRLYKKRLRAGSSGAVFNCSLWYKR